MGPQMNANKRKYGQNIFALHRLNFLGRSKAIGPQMNANKRKYGQNIFALHQLNFFGKIKGDRSANERE
jgi:hypothetical protein